MAEEEVTVFVCGKKGCDHEWNGEPLRTTDEDTGCTSEVATCSKCGMDSMTWALFNAP